MPGGLRPVLFVLAVIASLPIASAQEIRVRTGEGAQEGNWDRIEADGTFVLTTEAGEARRWPLSEILTVESIRSAPVGDPNALEVELTNGDRVFGTYQDGGREEIVVASEGFGTVRLPLMMVRALQFGSGSKPVPAGRSEAQEERLYLKNGDVLEGFIDGFGRDEVRIEWAVDGEIKSHKIHRVARIELSAETVGIPQPRDVIGVVETNDGSRIHARITSLSDRVLRVRSIYDDEEHFPEPLELEIPVGRVRSLTIKNGRFVYLSDLDPLETRSTPYFDENWGYERDRAWNGTPLSVGGKEYAKGIGTHAHFVLIYDLSGGFERFQAVVGIDDSVLETSSRTVGGFVFRIRVDGTLLHESDLVTRDGGARQIDVDVGEGERLELEVDYGPNGPVNARADWADAKLSRIR